MASRIDTTTQASIVHWNDPHLLALAGPEPERVIGLLKQYGQPQPTPLAVYQWVSRSAIPDRWRACLVYCLLRDGRLAVPQLFRRGDTRRREPVPQRRTRVMAAKKEGASA